VQPDIHPERQRTPEQREQRRRQRHEARASATYREFLRIVSAQLSLPRERAEEATLAVMSALEQRMPYDEMSDLASELPMKLRELLATCDEPEPPVPVREIGQAEFLAMVARDLDVSADEAERLARGVFGALAESVSAGEIKQVIQVLPKGLKELWPALD
jgi:uncharacterized protein (DUF2267 family)